MKNKKNKIYDYYFLYLFIVIPIIYFLLISDYSLSIFKNYFYRLDTLQPTDAIAVFGGGFTASKTLTSTSYERFSYGVFLFKKNLGRYKYLIFLGGVKNFRFGVTESEMMEKIAVLKYKINPEKIIIENKSKNTVGNIKFLKIKMKKYNIKTVTLVSSFPHIRRVSYTYEKLIGNRYVIASIPYCYFDDLKNKIKLRIYLKELTGMLYYSFKL